MWRRRGRASPPASSPPAPWRRRWRAPWSSWRRPDAPPSSPPSARSMRPSGARPARPSVPEGSRRRAPRRAGPAPARYWLGALAQPLQELRVRVGEAEALEEDLHGLDRLAAGQRAAEELDPPQLVLREEELLVAGAGAEEVE